MRDKKCSEKLSGDIETVLMHHLSFDVTPQPEHLCLSFHSLRMKITLLVTCQGHLFIDAGNLYLAPTMFDPACPILRTK